MHQLYNVAPIVSKKDDKDQETIQSSTTPHPGYHMGKYQKYNKHYQQESSPFTESDHKAAMNRRESMRNTKHKNTNNPQKKYRLGTVSNKYFTGGLKPVLRRQPQP